MMNEEGDAPAWPWPEALDALTAAAAKYDARLFFVELKGGAD